MLLFPSYVASHYIHNELSYGRHLLLDMSRVGEDNCIQLVLAGVLQTYPAAHIGQAEGTQILAIVTIHFQEAFEVYVE